MLVFHSSDKTIDKIDLSVGRKQVDFGQGFYVTTLREQAENWARLYHINFVIRSNS